MLDVVVVGAGLSGLVCARRLLAGGARVRVVEARDRVGGRLQTGKVGGQVVDLGGHLMTATQDRLAALARELGVESEVAERGGRARFPRGGLFAAIAQWRAIRRIERMMREPSPDLDARTLADHLATIKNRVARERIALHAELIFAADPADLSLLAYLERLGKTGGFMPRGPELPGGGRERYFPAGAQELATRLAANVEVVLGSPVTAIEDAGSEVHLRTDTQLSAKRVVLAVPPALVRAIAIDLPAPARGLVDRVGAGGVVKCLVAYATPFWREAGWSGEVYRPTGTVRATIATGSVVVAFVVGREAARWAARDPAERKAAVVDALAGEFGDAARAPSDYLEADWAADPWSAGCVATTPPNVLARGAAWAAPHGRIHIAGTESASVWPGYMEGAIEAGERAAAEVLAAL